MSASVSPHIAATDSEETLPIFLELVLMVSDPEIISELRRRPEGRDRDEFAMSALRLGVLALRQARGQLDAQALKREGDQLLSSVQSSLNEHRLQLHSFLESTLKEYFDPNSGRFNERVDRLLKKDGDLESLLSRKLTGDQSELQQALTTLVGEQSPLFRLLSPQESDGVLNALKGVVAAELDLQRQRVLGEFSLDNKDGALTRLVGEISTHSGKLRDDLQDKIDAVVREFSLDDEQSALSRLVQQVDRAQRTISAEFSLDNETSALSRMKAQVDSTNEAISRHLTLDDETSALSRLRRELLELLVSHEEKQRTFQQEVQVTLEKMQARKEEADRSTRHGTEFEALLFDLIQQESRQCGDIATLTGASTGLIKNCKKGDIVIDLSAEHTAAGARIVLEAKESASYSLRDALVEMEEARKNRDAQVGIFVFSKKTAPAGLEPLSRHGDDVLVLWDSENPDSDLFLRLAISLAKALCTRNARTRERSAIDFTTVDQALLEIAKQVDQIDEINTWAGTIQNNSEKIMERVRISRKKLKKQIDSLEDQLQEIKTLLQSTDD
ncbi:MAG: hypothetical protein U0903_04935 [Planctomycetales bacterium]